MGFLNLEVQHRILIQGKFCGNVSGLMNFVDWERVVHCERIPIKLFHVFLSSEFEEAARLLTSDVATENGKMYSELK